MQKKPRKEGFSWVHAAQKYGTIKSGGDAMENKRETICNRLKLIGFSAYFLILFIERLLAVILSPTHGAEYALTSGNGFSVFAYAVTALSLFSGTVLFVRLFVTVGRSLAAKEEYLLDDHLKEWCVASAVLLFAGMTCLERTTLN